VFTLYIQVLLKYCVKCVLIGVFVVCGRVVSSGVMRTHYATRHNTPIHNILSTTPQLSIYQKALGTLPEDGNVMPKHVGVTIYNL
jgi:hypothetical protein